MQPFSLQENTAGELQDRASKSQEIHNAMQCTLAVARVSFLIPFCVGYDGTCFSWWSVWYGVEWVCFVSFSCSTMENLVIKTALVLIGHASGRRWERRGTTRCGSNYQLPASLGAMYSTRDRRGIVSQIKKEHAQTHTHKTSNVERYLRSVLDMEWRLYRSISYYFLIGLQLWRHMET